MTRFAVGALVALSGCAGVPHAPSPERALAMLADQGPLAHADLIITHGCPARSDGAPSTCNMRRARTAVDAWRRGLAPRVLFTGGAVANRYPESHVMADYARTLGLPDSAILVETESHHTVTNLSVAKGIMKRHGWRSAIQVSEAMHLVWAKQLARFYGMKTELLPSDMVPPYTAAWLRDQKFDGFEPWRTQTAAYGVPSAPADQAHDKSARRVILVAMVDDAAGAAEVARTVASAPDVELQILYFNRWRSLASNTHVAVSAVRVWRDSFNGPVDEVQLVGVGRSAAIVRAAALELPSSVHVAAIDRLIAG